jgi:cupin 2 domain-containing protein
MTIPNVHNLLKSESAEDREIISTLLQTPAFRLEQIHSHGQPTPPGDWYDQPEPEWVLLLRGQATLRFETGELVELQAGDFLLIPASVRHRVDACSDDTVWLALHYCEN